MKQDHICYDRWIEMGLMRASSGNRIRYTDVTDWFTELRDIYDIYPMYIGYDNWSAVYWVEEMKNMFGKNCLITVIQGKKTLPAPMKALGQDLIAKKIIYNNNPIDRWETSVNFV